MRSSEIKSTRSSKSSKRILGDAKPTMTDRLDMKMKTTSKVQKIALQKVLAVKKIESAPWNGKRVLPRASRGTVAASVTRSNLLKSSILSSVGNKIKTRRRTINHGPAMKNVSKVSIQNSDQATTLQHSIEEGKGIIIKADETISETLIKSEQICNDNSEDKENTQDPIELPHEIKGEFSTVSEVMRNVVIPGKSYHRKRRCKPYKNEHLETCQSQAMTSPQSESEFNFFPQGPQTEKHTEAKQDEALEKELTSKNCTIICTPDIIIDRCLDNEVAEETEQPVPTFIDEKIGDKFDTIKDQHAADFPQDGPSPKNDVWQKNFTEFKSLNNLKDDASGLKSETQCHVVQKKGEQEASKGCLQRRLTHISTQTMPVYTSKIAVAKNEYRQKKQGTEIISASWRGCEDDNLGDKNSKNTDTKEQSPVPVTQVTPNLPSNTSPVNEKDKIAPPPRKYFITVNSDSDETLSNIESVPNSPGQDNWQISVQRYSSLTNNHQKNNHPQSKSPKRDRSPVACEISRCMNIENTEGDQNTELESGSIIKRQRLMIGGTLICSDEKTKLQPQYHTEASSTQNPSVLAQGSEKNTGDITHHNILKSPEEVSWLRHYERPRATYLNSDKNISKFEDNGKENLQKNEILSCAPKKNDETIKKPINVTIASDPAQPNSHAAGYLLGGRHDKRPKPVTQKLGKRGRPRKQDSQKSGPNSEIKKKPQGKTSDTRFNSEQTSAATGGEPGVNNSTSRPSGNGLTLNGHALSLWELQTLFFKFLQHGHFRVDPEQPLIFTFNNDDNKSFAAGMQCYDPKGYHTQPGNTDMTNNCDSKKNPHSQRRFSTNNDDSRHHSMHNAWPNDTSHWNCNSELPIYTNPISNYMQPQHSSPSHYHQNMYNNNANLMGNNINSDRGYMNSNSPMNDASNFSATTSNTNINFNQNIQRRYENSVNSREIDLSMTNKNAMPNNSTNPAPNISANNLSPSWRSDNTNGVITNANSMNCLNEFSQTLEGSTSVNNFIHSQNSPISVSDSWINRTNNAFNINKYSTFPPWQGSFPMYSSCLNNADPYYKNMFNPCNTLMALDLPNYPYQYTMENNSNQWMQNITPGDTGISAFNAPGSQYPRMNYGFSEEHPMNQGINLSLSSEAAVNTIVPETSFIDPDEANSGMEYRNALKCNSVESKKNVYQKVVSGVNNEMQTNARSYSDPICVPYSKGYKNDIQTRDIDDIDVINVVDDDIDILEEQNLPRIQDYVNRTLDSFEGCFNHAYKASNSSNLRTVTDLSNNTETELTKLRQELADFTKQYSENQTSSESSILHDDVYNYMMTQNLDVDRNST